MQTLPAGAFYHSVYFWLREPESAAAREEFVTAIRKMEAIPGVLHAFVGTPQGDAREVVDNSWTFFWLVCFENKDAWRVYEHHALHDEFRAKAALWTKVLVMDAARVG